MGLELEMGTEGCWADVDCRDSCSPVLIPLGILVLTYILLSCALVVVYAKAKVPPSFIVLHRP